jgi:hypothetical protein
MESGILAEASSLHMLKIVCAVGWLRQPRRRRASAAVDSLDVEAMQEEMRARQVAVEALRNDAEHADLQ